MTPFSTDDPHGEIELQLPLEIPLSTAPRQGRPHLSPPTARTPMAIASGRITVVTAFVGIAFLLLGARLIDAMLLTSPHTSTQDESYISDNTDAPLAARADITDRNGELIATSLPTQSLYAETKNILDPQAAARDLIKILPNLKFEDVYDKLRSPRRSIRLARSLTPEEVYQVNALGVPGFVFQTEMTRLYTAGSTLVHVLGYTDVDGQGLSGIERGLNERLKQGGDPIALSIDLRLQHVVARELASAIKDFRAPGGSGLVLDTWTGELLAAVSLPDYAPTAVGQASEEARFNRFSLGVYELGSVMKIVNTAAALESGKMGVNDFFDASRPLKIGNFTISDLHAENRWLSMPEVFLYSSNIASARMAFTMGSDFQHNFICKLGLCAPVPIEIKELGRPQLPPMAHWPEISSATVAFGHGISITPLHFARATAAAINGGILVTPSLIKQPEANAPKGERVMSERASHDMRRIMRVNVTHPDGTGKSAEVAGYYVGGKTGTAEKAEGRRYNTSALISSFIAAFPMYNPRYVVYVVLNEPKGNAATHGFATAGWVASPLAGRIIAQMGPLFGLKPLDPTDARANADLALEVRTRGGSHETQ